MSRLFFVTIFSLAVSLCRAQSKTDSSFYPVLAGNQDPLFQQVLRQPDRYRLQIIYTEINRDRHNKPHFVNHYYHYDPNLYFNPASTVKLPLAFLALEKLHSLRRADISRQTTIQFDSSQPWQKPLYRDTTAATGKPTLAHLVKRAFLVSENDPFNRLYQFVGQGQINRQLHEKGYADVRITRQFLGLTPEQNRWTNAIRFVGNDGQTVYRQPPAYNKDSFDFSRVVKVGNAHLNGDDSLIQQPFDFTMHNTLSLQTLQQLLQSVIFPQSVPPAQRFSFANDDRHFLLQYLSQFPSETPDPNYDTASFYDSYVKFFFRDSTRRLPPGVRVFNKVGWAYGFLTDVSYVADFDRGVEFMLSATLYVNDDGVLNDNKYEYAAIGWPFLYQLGQTVYAYEKARPRKYRPNLSALRITYERRDPADKRPPLREVDN